MSSHHAPLSFVCVFLLAATAALLACGSSDGGSSNDTAPVSFAISDAPVGNLRDVTITIESLTVRRAGAGDEDDDEGGDRVVIDTFDTDEGEVERITINLLDYQGSNSELIVDEIELEVGEYADVRLEIIDEDEDFSWVVEQGDDERKTLKVPSDELKLGGFEVEEGGVQTFVLEFNLPRSMTYNPGPDRYILKPRGVRVVAVEAAASIAVSATDALLDDCVSGELERANRVYLYAGHDLDPEDLGDAFDPEVDLAAPAETIEPLTAEFLDEDGDVEIGFVPAGDYTLAFSCDAPIDDAEFLDGIVIPNPDDQRVELSLEPGEEAACEFALDGASCS